MNKKSIVIQIKNSKSVVNAVHLKEQQGVGKDIRLENIKQTSTTMDKAQNCGR